VRAKLAHDCVVVDWMRPACDQRMPGAVCVACLLMRASETYARRLFLTVYLPRKERINPQHKKRNIAAWFATDFSVAPNLPIKTDFQLSGLFLMLHTHVLMSCCTLIHICWCMFEQM
jgi:hypothetical protein